MNVDALPWAQATPAVSGEGDAGSDGGTEEAERERAFVGCKPLAPAEATRAAEAAEAPTAPRIGRIFYGNDTFYIFFRLHQLLYDRCAHALGPQAKFPTHYCEPFVDEPRPAQSGFNAGIIRTTLRLHAATSGEPVNRVSGGMDPRQISAMHGLPCAAVWPVRGRSPCGVFARAAQVVVKGCASQRSSSSHCGRLRRAVRCAACIDQPGSFNPDLDAETPLPELDDKGAKAHGQFMTYVFDLIDGTRDSSQYEDDVRALLGALCSTSARFADRASPTSASPLTSASGECTPPSTTRGDPPPRRADMPVSPACGSGPTSAVPGGRNWRGTGFLWPILQGMGAPGVVAWNVRAPVGVLAGGRIFR